MAASGSGSIAPVYRASRVASSAVNSAYSPSWSFVVGLLARVPATVLKLAPGIDHALLPTSAEAEWVSVNGDVCTRVPAVPVTVTV